MKTFQSIAVALSLMSYSASAQSYIRSGNVELGGDVTFASQSSPNSGTVTTLSVNPYVGFMTANGFEFGLMPGLASVSGGGSSYTQVNLFLAPSYNISTGGTMYPYFEFLLGYNSITSKTSYSFYGANSQTADGLGIGMDAGLKVNLTGNGLLLFKIQYLHQSYKESAYSNDFSLNTFSFGVGFRIFIEGKERKK